MTSTDQTLTSMWPDCRGPQDIRAIEETPLHQRGLPATTYSALIRAVVLWPDRTAITVAPGGADWDHAVALTYADLLGTVHRYANVLHRFGVRRSDAVALMSPNTIELISATLAAQLAGIAAPINGSLTETQVAQLIGRSGARVLIAADPNVAPETWHTAAQLAAEGRLDTILLLRSTGASATEHTAPPNIPGVTVDYLDDLAAGENADSFAGEPPKGTDLAALFHTGGTTGLPKLAAHTHANEVVDAWMLALPLGELGENDSIFAALPLFHVNAMIVTVLSPLLQGRHVVWAGPLGYRDPALLQRFWDIVEHHRIGAMSAVPTVYAQLAHIPVNADISSLRYPIVGASPLPEAVRKSFRARTGVSLLEGYGMTEATCASALNFPDAPRPGSVGHRMPYQGIRVIADAAEQPWRPVPAGDTGVLTISGPTVFAGYVVGRDEHGPVLDTLGSVVDGWLNTGDLASIDDDGFIRLRGRVKDLIIRGGHNIEPGIIEDALLSHPSVVAAAAVGRPDAHSGEVPVAYVALGEGEGVDADELRQWAAAHVSERAAAPKEVTILDAIPVTAVGKPNKLSLRCDATRVELVDALRDIADIDTVTAKVDDGTIVATVTTATVAAKAAAEAVVGRYSIEARVIDK